MSKSLYKIQPEHIKVLKILYDNGNISRQAMKSIRGQILSMQSIEAEKYLQKIIKKSMTPANVGG